MKLSPQMLSALNTAGRRGVYPLLAKKQTLDALIRRGLAAELTRNGARNVVFATESGLEISAEERSKGVLA